MNHLRLLVFIWLPQLSLSSHVTISTKDQGRVASCSEVYRSGLSRQDHSCNPNSIMELLLLYHVSIILRMWNGWYWLNKVRLANCSYHIHFILLIKCNSYKIWDVLCNVLWCQGHTVPLTIKSVRKFSHFHIIYSLFHTKNFSIPLQHNRSFKCHLILMTLKCNNTSSIARGRKPTEC